MKDLISVIVPVYNVEKYLNRCVDSILNQTYKNLEVILVDDGSPDNCPAICDDYAKKDKRVKVIHKSNGGTPAGARNAGLDIAKGDFIAFVDSDDWIDYTMYEKLLNKQKENNADLVFCRYSEFDDNKVVKVQENNLNNIKLDYFICSDNTTEKNGVILRENGISPNVWRVLFKKDIFNQLRFSTDIIIAEDLLLMLKVFYKNNRVVNYVDEYLYYYMVRYNSVTHAISDDKWCVAQKYGEEASKLFGENSDYTKAIQFGEFARYYCWESAVYNKKMPNKRLFNWNSKKHYKAHKKFRYNISFSSKLLYFLIHMRARWIIYLLYKLKKH